MCLKVRPLYQAGYVTPRVGNLKEENSRESMFDFPTDVCILFVW
jgi:hypothetical protein